MTNKLSEALNKTELVYNDLVIISKDMTNSLFGATNELIEKLEQINNLSIDSLRDYMLKLQLEAYRLSEIREKASFKSAIAEALLKEKFAASFSAADGSAAVKDKIALLASSEETLTENIYSLVSGLFKTKVDQLHRLIDVLKSILMSRMQEQKFLNLSTTDDPDSYKTKVQLDEENSRRI